MKLQDTKATAFVEPHIVNNDTEDDPFKNTINFDYRSINGTAGVFFNDTEIVLNELKVSPTILTNDMEVAGAAYDKKLESESTQIEEVTNSYELIADRVIREYFNLDCSECCVEFKTFYEFKCHFKIVHQQKGKVKCCEKTFSCRFEVLEHISLHQNPDKFKY